MKIEKQHKKLVSLQVKAEICLSRKGAKKIIRQAEKVHKKLEKI